MRNQAVGLLEQEANKEPRAPVPAIEPSVETVLGKASGREQLRPRARIVSTLVIADGSDNPIGGGGHRAIGINNKAAVASSQRLSVIAAPAFQ